MSNPIKAIGKVFKGVVKVVKKIALPAIAIGAAVLTGGAALGILPSVGSVLGAGGLGLSTGLTSVLSSAGQGALMGMATSAVTGGNIVKGATTGGIMGAALGGFGQLTKGAGGPMSAGSSAPMVSNTPADIVMGKDLATTGFTAPTAATAGTTSNGIGSMVAAAPKGVVAPVTGSAAVNAAPAATAAASAATGGGFGSLLSAPLQLINGLDPYSKAALIQGIGGGISAKAQADAEQERDDAKAQRIADNYGSGSSFFSSPATTTQPAQPKQRVIWKVDPVTGNVYKDYE